MRANLLRFRIKQLSKARIINHVLEIRVGARLNAVLAIQLDRRSQMLQAFLRLSRHAVQHRQSVMRKVRPLVLFQDIFQVVTRIFIIAGIQQRDRIVILLAQARKRSCTLLGLPFARCQIDLRSLYQLWRRSRQQLLKCGARFVELGFLHQLHRTLIHLQCLLVVFADDRTAMTTLTRSCIADRAAGASLTYLLHTQCFSLIFHWPCCAFAHTCGNFPLNSFLYAEARLESNLRNRVLCMASGYITSATRSSSDCIQSSEQPTSSSRNRISGTSSAFTP